jgi:hypothetical protein
MAKKISFGRPAMPDYLLLMRDDAPGDASAGGGEGWDRYFARLRSLGCFQGGSAIGPGVCVRKHGDPAPLSPHLGGFIRVSAENLDAARALVSGNPVYEAGGTVEIRELPRTG